MGRRLRFVAIALAAVLAVVVWKAWDGSVQTTSADPWPPVEVTHKATSNPDGTVTFAVTVKNVTTVDLTNVELRATVQAPATYVDSYQAGPGDDKGKFDGTSVNWMAGSISPGASKGPFNYIVKGDATVQSHVWMRWSGKQAGSLTTSDVTAAAGSVVTSGVTPTTPSATTPSASGTTTTTQKEVPLTPATAAPVAQLEIVAVPGNAADPNAITGKLADGTTVAMYTSGLDNVSVGAPVVLRANVEDPKNGPARSYTWTFLGPSASKSKLDKTDAQVVKFTPDVSGIYKVDVVISNEKGKSEMASVQIHAGKYIGSAACQSCHASKYAEWSKTPHATKLQRELNGGSDPATSHYNEGCIRCHTTGYYIGASNGGFADVQAQTGWTFPSTADIQAGKDNFSAMPKALQAVSNIGCEDCHGPGLDHVTKGTKMAVTLDNGVCNQCHAGGGSHIKGLQIENSPHSDADATPWNEPTGPAEQACVRCHTGAGYITFTQAPTEQASWNNEKHTLGCASCHDPHSDENPLQLRVVGKPVNLPAISNPPDEGLSATCFECHNGRRAPQDPPTNSMTHRSPMADQLLGVNGVTYGQTLPSSPHSLIVGAAPMKNASGAAMFGGNTPGPCVVCHMWTSTTDTKDPNYLKVGEHSFNVVNPTTGADYTAACQQCHPGITSFNFTARGDYDGNGKTEGVQTEVAGLLKVLEKAINDSGIPTTTPASSTAPANFDSAKQAAGNAKQLNAIWNYKLVGADGTGAAAAVHNFKRSVALLQASYKDLMGKDVPGATLIK